MMCRGGSERGLGDGVVSCSRTPHDKAVVGGRAQAKLPRHLVLGMRVELKKMRSRSTRAREVAILDPFRLRAPCSNAHKTPPLTRTSMPSL